MRSFLHMTPQQGYQRAKGLLKEHFGSEHRIATACMNKAFGWPVIKSRGCSGTALFLRGCCYAMTEIQYMEELNIPSNMTRVIMKRPYKLREKWRSTCEIQERRGYRATFPDMANFLENQVKISSHPLFGNISDARPSTIIKALNRRKPLPKSNIKRTSFAITIAATNSAVIPKPTVHKMQKQPIASEELQIPYCEESHPLFKCSN